MIELDRTEGVAREKAVLVGVLLSEQGLRLEPLDELTGLAETAGAVVVGSLLQRRNLPDKTTYLGKGKVEELKELTSQTKADVILFDNDLSPAQTRNLEKATGVKVLDRTEVILDIFANRAQTHESRLAVELAQLEYSLPRLKRMWTHLSRMKMGVGMRGPGEKQLETDRRIVERRISDLRGNLQSIEQRKERQVAGRRDHMTVSLIGYTNAGKSTLMNALTGSEVTAADKLFATLDTRTRRWHLPGWGPVLLSDTVGFIRDLPHRLIASFKATLMEARDADLLLHVADASNPAVFDQIRAVYAVLEELGIEEKDTLLVLNKIDQVTEAGRIEGLLNRYPNAVCISAKSGDGLGHLATHASGALSRGFLDIDVEAGVDNGKLLAYLAAHGEILSRRYDGDRVFMHVRMPQKYVGKLRGEDVQVRSHAESPSGMPLPAADSREELWNEGPGGSNGARVAPGTAGAAESNGSHHQVRR